MSIQDLIIHDLQHKQIKITGNGYIHRSEVPEDDMRVERVFSEPKKQKTMDSETSKLLDEYISENSKNYLKSRQEIYDNAPKEILKYQNGDVMKYETFKRLVQKKRRELSALSRQEVIAQCLEKGLGISQTAIECGASEKYVMSVLSLMGKKNGTK